MLAQACNLNQQTLIYSDIIEYPAIYSLPWYTADMKVRDWVPKSDMFVEMKPSLPSVFKDPRSSVHLVQKSLLLVFFSRSLKSTLAIEQPFPSLVIYHNT
jgi:hypothetical protein